MEEQLNSQDKPEQNKQLSEDDLWEQALEEQWMLQAYKTKMFAAQKEKKQNPNSSQDQSNDGSA